MTTAVPLISVIIPVYNAEKTIVDSLDSVVKECMSASRPWEIILVDDGSKDKSAEAIEAYLRTCEAAECITLVKQENKGASAARNNGLRRARGEFIAFNDSDDRWLEGKIIAQINYMADHPEIDMVGCRYDNDNFRKGSLIKLQQITPIRIETQVSKNYFSPPTVMLRRSILEKSGLFNEKLRYAEEGYFFNNIVFHGNAVFMSLNVAEPIMHKARWGDSGLSGNLVKMEQGELYNIRAAYRQQYISLPRYIFAICFSLAKFCRRWLISKFRKLWK